MKKFVSALVILVIVLVSGVLSIRYFKSSSDQLVKSIENTSTLVSQENWSAAKTGVETIDKEWSSTEKTWALLTDHVEVDNIELSLKKSREYINTGSSSEAMAELEGLKFMVEHIYSKEQFNLKNIF